MSQATLTKLAYSPEEAAELLSISRAQIFRLISDSRIDSFKIGRKRVISLEAIQRFIAEGEEVERLYRL